MTTIAIAYKKAAHKARRMLAEIFPTFEVRSATPTIAITAHKIDFADGSFHSMSAFKSGTRIIEQFSSSETIEESVVLSAVNSQTMSRK